MKPFFFIMFLVLIVSCKNSYQTDSSSTSVGDQKLIGTWRYISDTCNSVETPTTWDYKMIISQNGATVVNVNLNDVISPCLFSFSATSSGNEINFSFAPTKSSLTGSSCINHIILNDPTIEPYIISNNDLLLTKQDGCITKYTKD